MAKKLRRTEAQRKGGNCMCSESGFKEIPSIKPTGLSLSLEMENGGLVLGPVEHFGAS